MAVCGFGPGQARNARQGASACHQCWGAAMGFRGSFLCCLLNTYRTVHQAGTLVFLETAWQSPSVATHAMLGYATGA